MMIFNQPHRLVTFPFEEITPRLRTYSKNIVRKFKSIIESSKFLHDKLSSNKRTLQIRKHNEKEYICGYVYYITMNTLVSFSIAKK